jgi:hypothetical protein
MAEEEERLYPEDKRRQKGLGMGNAGRGMLVAVLIVTLVAVIVALPLLLQNQVKSAGAAAPKPAPTDFSGAETCKTCHADSFERFATTSMGKLFLNHPRNAKEALITRETPRRRWAARTATAPARPMRSLGAPPSRA